MTSLRTGLLVVVASLQLVWIATRAAPSLLKTARKSPASANLVATIHCLVERIASDGKRILLPADRA